MLLLKKYKEYSFLIGIFILLFIWFAYGIRREDEFQLFLFFFFTFIIYIRLCFLLMKSSYNFQLKHILLFTLIIRSVLLFMTPNLSDDFYRFIWDGQVALDGGNPYAQVPSTYQFKQKEIEVYAKENCFLGSEENFPNGMNSKDYYSVYPPFSQFVFIISSWISGHSVLANIIVIRIILLLFECIAIYLFLKILDLMNMSRSRIWIYVLNPLVIIELSGNLHFEGITLSFVLLALYLLFTKRNLIAGIAFGLAICTKLIPLLFIPFLMPLINLKKFLVFITMIFVICFVLFIPYIEVDLKETFGKSILLYFNTFEFNASIYYLLRWVGGIFTGYNQIAIIGKITPLLIIIGIVILFIKFQTQKSSIINMSKYITWLLLIYFGLASVVHPWYLIYLVCFTVFTGYLFPIVWSAAALLSYLAYKETGEVSENYFVIFIEYFFVLIAVLVDLKKIRFRSFFLMDDDPRLPV